MAKFKSLKARRHATLDQEDSRSPFFIMMEM
jgi:hypothetical protein